MLNYYQVLEIDDFSSADDIRKAYRNKCREYHPDRLSTLGDKLKSLAESEMIIINKANDILSDHKKKEKFDDWLKKATMGHSLQPCRRCGIHYSTEESDKNSDICPICVQRADRSRETQEENAVTEALPEDILRNCFIVIHHFVSSSTLHKFNPSIYMMVSGETVIATGAPGALIVTLTNKKNFDLIHPDFSFIKHKWNPSLEMGNISFNKSHPVDAAETLWKFMGTIYGRPRLEYCRIEVASEDFKPYEHVLNQSVIVLASEVSPWNASKLLSRHRRNLVAAANDPEASNPDPFIAVMTGGAARDPRVNPTDIKEKYHLLQSSLLATKEQLTAQKKALDNWKEQVEDLIGQISALKKENSEMRRKLDEAERVRVSGARLENENRLLRTELNNAYKIEQQIARFATLNTALEDKFLSEQKYIDKLTELKNQNRIRNRVDAFVQELIVVSSKLAQATEVFEEQNTLSGEICLKLASIENSAADKNARLLSDLSTATQTLQTLCNKLIIEDMLAGESPEAAKQKTAVAKKKVAEKKKTVKPVKKR